MADSDGNVSDEYELIESRSEWSDVGYPEAAAAEGRRSQESKAKLGPFSCKACSSLLRDNVECSSCHSLFCREHLVVDKSTSKSACPCVPCMFNNSPQPVSTCFLPNIPVQRMADAVPSRCESCGVSLSWGELAAHACDLQVVPCQYARWGCSWKNQRQHLPGHLESSTCKGELASARHTAAEAKVEIAAVRAELAAARAATEAAEQRAATAEMRTQELEAKVAKAEESIRDKDETIAKTRKAAENFRTMTAAAASSKISSGKANTSVVKETSSTVSGGSSSGASSGAGGATTQAQIPNSSARHQPTSFNIQQQISSMFNKGSNPSSGVNGGTASLAGQQTDTNAPSTSRSTGTRRAEGAVPQHQQGSGQSGACAPPSAVTARPVVEAACQAPVPATEACLKPYLERPHSLLEKEVVVFWPRQGRWYVGRPTAYKQATKEHRVEYDDGDVRDHVLAHRSWGLIG